MKRILVLGAGRSSAWLIRYLLEQAVSYNWHITVADQSEAMALKKTKHHANSSVATIAFEQENTWEHLVQSSHAVISLLPPTCHINIAHVCLKHKVSLFTASYVSPEMKSLDEAAKSAGLLFLNEMGLDPGIDHLSAMALIDNLHQQGARIDSFSSYCGGLIAPASDTNPWHYKFTWNPMNVVTAGQATAAFLKDGKVAYITPQRIFLEAETLDLGEFGSYEAYANRDSLAYIHPYRIANTPIILRGTLRGAGYCRAWSVLAALGITDNQVALDPKLIPTYDALVQSLLPQGIANLSAFAQATLGERFASELMQRLHWLDLESNRPIPAACHTPAQALLALLEEKWRLEPQDIDRIVMHHRIDYTVNGQSHQLQATLVVDGDDQEYTAMAKTVGLPLAMGVKQFLLGNIKQRGVIIPTEKEIYEPVLKELKAYGVQFTEVVQ